MYNELKVNQMESKKKEVSLVEKVVCSMDGLTRFSRAMIEVLFQKKCGD